MGSACPCTTACCPKRRRSSLPLCVPSSACLSGMPSFASIRTHLSSTSEPGMSSGSIPIRLENVTQRFRVIQERPDTLRELFSKFFHHQSHYHDFDAVKNVSLEVPKGQMLGLIGRNGSGKSTLLKIVAGVYQPTAGRVHVEGS